MQQIIPVPTTHPDETALVPVTHIPADRHPALAYLASLARGSRRTMRGALDTIADLLTHGRCDHRTLPWGVLRFQHTQAVRAALQEQYSAATANKMLSALKQTLKFAWQLGYMSGEEYQQAVSVGRIRGEKPAAAAGRALRPGEWAALLGACAADPGPAGVRDAALLALFLIAGLRRFEAAALNVGDYDPAEQTLLIRGKRNKTRLLPIEDTGALDALADWRYTLYICNICTEAPSPLFTRIRKGGAVTPHRLTDQGIYHILENRRQQAQVAPFTPHDLRRTFAGDLLDAGVDLATVQKLMGHANANTTAGYDRRGERAKREAVRRLHVPYTRRFQSEPG
jgi:site-specific recombinase XerD